MTPQTTPWLITHSILIFHFFLKLSDKLDIPKLCAARSFIIDAYSLEDVTHLKMLLEKFTNIIKKGDESTSDTGSKDFAQDDAVKGRL